MNYTDELFNLQDSEYADFQAKLTPNIPRDNFIGVRVPLVRTLAKKIIKEENPSDFLNSLPHSYYDENMLHGLLISEIEDYTECIKAVDTFLPFVDNWAVCDIMSPKIFKKNKDRLLVKIAEWISSEKEYTCRFGIEMLMSHFLDEDFKIEYLEMVASVRSDYYYIKMMVAWFFATALAKQWDATIPVITENRLAVWEHNKSIQKAKESFRINDEQKSFLSSLKRK